MEKAYIAAVMSMLLPMPITICRPSVTAFPTCRQADVQFNYELMSVSNYINALPTKLNRQM